MSVISVVIPLYNADQYIEDTLVSLQNQTFRDWNCLVVDDGSSDDSYIVAKEFDPADKRIQVIKRPSHIAKGPSAIRNYGIQQSESEFINFLDADDIIHPRKFETLMTAIRKQPNAVAAISRSFHFENSIDNLTRPWKKGPIDSDILERFIRSESGWQTGDPLWRRSILSKKMFDERLFGPDDWIAHIEILLKNSYNKFIFVDEVLSYIRVLPVSLHTEPSVRRLESDVLSRRIVLRYHRQFNFSSETIDKLIKDLLVSSRESLNSGYFSLGLRGLALSFPYLFKSEKYLKLIELWLLGIPAAYLFKRGYSYFKV